MKDGPLSNLNRKPLMTSNLSEALARVDSISMSEIPMPEFHVSTPAEKADFESAATIIKNLGTRIRAWKEALSSPFTPAVFAILPNGMTVDVSSLKAEGHHGLVIQGEVDDKPVMVTMHQNNFVTVCLAVESDINKPRPEIGFHST